MWDTIKRVLAVLTHRERLAIIPLVAMMTVGALLESVGIALIIPLISGFMDMSQVMGTRFGAILAGLFAFRDPRTYLVVMIVALVVLFVVKNAFLVWQAYALSKYSARVRKRIQNRLLHYYLRREYPYFLQSNSGDILRTITVDSDYFYALLNQILHFFSSIIMAVIILVVVLAIDAGMTLTLGLVLALEYLLIVKYIKPFLRRYGKKYRTALGRGNSQIIEMLRGIKFVKAGATERFFENRYAKQVDEIVDARMVEKAFEGAPSRLIEAVTVSALLIYLLVLVCTGQDMAAIVPTLSALVLAAAKLLPAVGSLSNAVSFAGYYDASLRRVEEIDRALTAEGEPAEACAASGTSGTSGTEASATQPTAFTRELALDRIRFRYPDADTYVLDGASMAIPANHAVGIMGASGAGKTTAVDILLGLLQPEDGAVLIDEQPADTRLVSWKHLFAYIPQNVFLLAGSIRDNVVFGQEVPPSDEHRVWKALEAARLADFVRSLERGLDSDVGEAGVRLSGGQAQRLGIARALFTDAPVLVFDEATSSLDNETEAELLRSIEELRGSRTIVVIAHRLSTIRNCDLVYCVENGTIALGRLTQEVR